jgi:DNA mismatch repair ATPase MutS
MASLFEAEVTRCATMIEKAKEANETGRRALFLLDEPMHSTPPIEGAATAMATVEKLAEYENVRVLCTTHYHDLARLEKLESSRFMNVSMECVQGRQGFLFPYRLRKGPSFQCIALELLASKQIPEDVVARAIEIKNKICASVLE